MQTLLLAAAFATASSTANYAKASEYRLLPNLYAERYCSLRQIGVSREQAIGAAVKEYLVPGSAPQVTINGKIYDVDVVEAAAAVKRICPIYLTQ